MRDPHPTPNATTNNPPATPRAQSDTPLVVLVCGGRDYGDRRRVEDTLDALSAECGIACLVHGDCRTGADAHADRWARAVGVPVERYPADWAGHGRAAGPLRNARMLADANPDVVVAFPGGSGTADMIRRAKAAGVPVQRIA